MRSAVGRVVSGAGAGFRVGWHTAGMGKGLISIGFYFLAVFFECWRCFVWAGGGGESLGGGVGHFPDIS